MLSRLPYKGRRHVCCILDFSSRQFLQCSICTSTSALREHKSLQINFCNGLRHVSNRPRLLYNVFITNATRQDLRNCLQYVCFRLQSTCSSLTAFRRRAHGHPRDLELHYQVQPFMQRGCTSSSCPFP